ncbi:MAG TPA: C25 family cysteine peptidase [Candidatus Cloacimonadota bacterium]|nr:C25 family cysteine peptidase [Candidatus Cloacimonadota bacterium]HOV16099.1 C25 family cysteine peptidase [Candidatus Cloacimonadota bacterium]HQL14805.1 C25 family cysteine peptidase [Candidatus Cloacimonadota bacterium]
MKRLLPMLLLLMVTLSVFAAQYTVNSNQNEVKLLSSDAQMSVLEMTLGHFEREQVIINGETYWLPTLKKEGITQDAGYPQLPYVTRSLAIPGSAKMQLRILESEYTEVEMQIAPSKGILTRDINPETMPWNFSPFYAGNSFYPDALAKLSEPFIIRDYRGITIYFQPFVYYPATKTLRIYTRIKVAVENTGMDNVNILPQTKNSASAWFDNIYRSLFLNYDQAKYTAVDEQGTMLIITNSMFDATLQPYIDWKRQKGFTVNVVDIATAGPSASQLKTYIQNQYNQNNDLAFVQIIGDAAQVPTLTSGGGGSDPSFALVAGTDSYPDIFVGRFSAQTTTELETQITRTIYYERDMQANNAWLATGMGIASSQGGGSQGDMGESDQTHIGNIRTDLLNYGYTSVDQIYETTGATAAMISAGVNAGRGIINYCGHGADTYWVTTSFSNTNVNQLTNNNKLPFIISVACVNGNFVNQTCFAEAWLRARDSATGSPTGAMAFYGSSINQSWNSPMRAQDEINDLLVANAKNTIGGLYFNGACKMIEVYGSDGVNTYKTWNIFGDASLQVRTTNPQPLTATFNPLLYLDAATFTVQTAPGAWVTLSANGTVYATGHADASGLAVLNLLAPLTENMELTLTITGFNKVTYLGSVQVQNANGPYVQILNQYVTDGNNNLPEYGETVNLNLTLNNVGLGEAQAVIATISSNDPYLTILDNTADFQNIPPGEFAIVPDNFQIQISDNVSDQHIAVLHVIITQNGTVSWVYDIDFILNAPAFTLGNFTINDMQGNNNGRLDTGEIDILNFPVTNIGHAAAQNLLVSLLVNNPVTYLLTPLQTSFTRLEPGETAQASFQIVFSSQIPSGTLIQMMLMGFAGNYSIIQNFNSYLGLVIESFDSGDFTSYPWEFTGTEWTVDNTDFYTGAYSARSGNIDNNTSSCLSVTIIAPADGTISFWKKVSSEQNNDFLKFYINNVLQSQWSGTIAWSQETFNVSAGTNTFKWEYAKNIMLSSGSDCAWIDDIIFPVAGSVPGTPLLCLSTVALDFGAHQAADFTPMPLGLTNSGDATVIGTIIGNNLIKIRVLGTEDYFETLNFVIPPSRTFDYQVMVFPQTEGNFSGSLSVTSDDPRHLNNTIPVTAVVLPTANDDNHAVLVTALKGVYPNPFNRETTVNFSQKGEGKVSLEIYNLLGQKVKTLVNSGLKSGNYSYKWNGKDDKGRDVSSGIYFCRMQSGNYQATLKMILMK